MNNGIIDIYIGSQRIVSKLGDLQSYGADPRRIPYAGSESDNVSVDYKNKYAQQQQIIKNNYATFDVPYNGKDNNNYADGEGFCCDDKPKDGATTRSLDPGQNDNPEKFQFYYHPDHLGSSSYITNLDGNVVQHIEYVPFGEVFLEERNNKWNTPYLFNAKELDEETGLYYYGARYYNPRISLWLSVDPLQEQHPNLSSYCYTANNPVKYIDPDGKEWDYYIDKNGRLHINVDIKFKIEANLSKEQISGYKSAINAQFSAMLQEASYGLITGSVTYGGGKNAKQFTPDAFIYETKDSKITGSAGYGALAINLIDGNNNLKSPEQFASDFLHELFHTVRLAHPFEKTQSLDAALIKVSGNNFIPLIGTKEEDMRQNIMSYSMIKINGVSFDDLKTNKTQSKITLGQINFILKEIDLQKKGFGFKDSSLSLREQSEKYNNYWSNEPHI